MEKFTRDYIEFEIKMLSNIEDEFYETQDERIRQLILHSRIVLRNYWERKKDGEIK